MRNNREEARQYFKECGLDYSIINEKNLRLLINKINAKILSLEDTCLTEVNNYLARTIQKLIVSILITVPISQ
jgi:hypothetical protein